jgi:hypothetical protein
VSWVAFGAATDAHRSLLFVVVLGSRNILVRGGRGGDGKGEEGGELCGCGADGKVEGDSLGDVSRVVTATDGLAWLTCSSQTARYW